ncbi:hypothetical protein [Pseudomonas bharatica]|uniref:hypothetical protein n=1 Tax=Pseudomonas bharatica TaxID=2692112 RepID=UPI003B28C648
MTDLPAAWVAKLMDRFELIIDPDGRAAALAAIATAAHCRGEITDGQLAEMLELADAGRLWALVELEEADRVGLFDGWD